MKATKIYARFATEVYDDFGESEFEQEYYRKEHADEELRATKRALWLARAMNGYNTTYNETSYHTYMIEHPDTKISMRRWFGCWNLVERKCREYAERFK